MISIPNKTSQTLLCFVALTLVPYFVPSFQKWRAFTPSLSPTTVQASSASPLHTIIEAKPGEIEDASGQALQHFFAALNQTQNGKGIVRISHYGDSPITGDMITSTVRRKLQLQFGDAGHGFVLLAKPWGWYQHLGVKHEASGWESDPMFIGKGDHRFGFGGASFTARSAGAIANFSAADEGETGSP